MRASDIGFFEMTNKITGYTGYARLDSTGAWTVVSDRRLKTDITPAAGNLDAALRLRPVTYRWLSDGAKGETHLGLIAQDVRDVLPDFVVGDENKGTLTVNCAGLSTAAIGAIQELKQQKDAEIEALRSDNAALRESNQQLSDRLSKLEALVAELAGKQPIARPLD
jgi:hypothetical protein